jgi:hypothetical protein
MTATIIKGDKIFKYLETLRKENINVYVLQWASNTGSDFVMKMKNEKHSKINFHAQLESLEYYTERGLKADLEIISNQKFKSILIEKN